MSHRFSLSFFGFFSCLLVFLTVSAIPNTLLADHRVRPIASELSARADHLWNAAQDRLQERYYGGPEGEEAMILYMALSNFANSARLYRNFANSFTDENLRGGAKGLLQQADTIDRMMERIGVFGHLREDWRRVHELLGALAQEFNIPTRYPVYRGGGRPDFGRRDRDFDEPYRDPRPGSYGGDLHGRFRWRGLVDGEDLIKVRGRDVWIEHVKEAQIRDASYDLTGPLPAAPVKVDLKRIRGRGDIDIEDMPQPKNNFTLAVRVRDKKAGPDFYEFEIVW